MPLRPSRTGAKKRPATHKYAVFRSDGQLSVRLADAASSSCIVRLRSMPERLKLALVFHQHQPAGNFPSVFKDVTEKAYAPLVAALYRHARVRATLHFTGPLLDWLKSNRPDVLGDITDLKRRGQIELLSGGYYEPILIGVPRRDAVAQIRALTDRLSAAFGTRPLGAWLAERVWEPQVPSILAEAGIAYTIDDDARGRLGLPQTDAPRVHPRRLVPGAHGVGPRRGDREACEHRSEHAREQGRPAVARPRRRVAAVLESLSGVQRDPEAHAPRL